MVAPNNSPRMTEAQAQRLLDEIDFMTAAEKMSDANLSDAAIHAFIKLNGGIDYAVLNELVNRFDRLAGIKRDEETGEVIS